MTGCGAVILGTMQKVRLTLHRETSGGVIKKKKSRLSFLFAICLQHCNQTDEWLCNAQVCINWASLPQTIPAKS